jgi:predicted outer membrane protein
MRRTGLLRASIAAGIIVIGGCSTPSDQQPARGVAVGTGGAAANVQSDGEFVHDVVIMNMAEIELSRAALDKATSADLKAFAQKLIGDHEVAGNKLKTVVSGRSVEWPAQLDSKHREIAEELAKKQGADFDRSYMEAMIEGHQNLAARLESRLDVQSLADWKTAAAARTQTQALPDPQAEMRDVQPRPNKSGDELTMKINQWAAETYPVAQKHLDTARTLENATNKRSTR